MGRSRRPRQRRSGTSSVQLAQVVGLGVLLVMILLFRDKIAGNAGAFLSAFDSPDIRVEGDTGPGKQISTKPDAGIP